jgi:hypothetical protein
LSNVPTNLIPTRITGLPEYQGTSTLGYMPYIIDGRTFKVQFANIAAVGAVPSSREINTGSGLGGGGDLSTNRTLFILPGGVDDSRLTTTGVTAGTYGAADSVPVLTVNAQGRVTGATSAPIVLANYVPTSRTITAGAGLTGGGDLSANRSFAVIFSSTTPEPLGPGSSGVSTVAARGDHVHPAVDLSDTTETQGVLPLSRGGTGNSLSPVAGAIVYSSNDKLYLTTAGSIGQVLRSGGPGGVPFWTEVGAGTVISVAVATANGFAGTVASPTLSPIITLSTTVSGLLKGNGTELSAATAGIDYVAPGAYTASGLTLASARLLGRTTASVGAAEEISVGNGLTLASGSLVNAAPDQVVALTGGTAISVTGSYPSFTVTNTAPDQVVSLTGAGTTTVTGTYPSFTITSNDSTAGTVTSVNASGGTTGMSFTGGPITSAGTLTLNGTLAIVNGGTGATDAVAALTNLGAYPASNPSGFTSNVGTVTSVSGTGTVSGLSLSGTVTSAGSLTLGGTLAVLPSNFASQTANTVLAAPNGSAGTPTFRAIVAADIPTLNQNTTGTASNVTGIVAIANGGTGASVAATARTNLSAAASGANTDITSIALTTGTISTSPVNGTDIVNKAYADSIASGINFHQSVRLATAAALPANTYNNGTSGVGATLTANANGALSVDGVAVVAGNRILVKDEAAGANNGVYTVTQVGNGSTPYILTRATDFDSAGTGVDQIDAGDFFLVTAGSTLSNTSWVQQTPLPITVGTTPITFTQFAAPVLYSAGTGLTLTGTVFSITNTGVSASTYGSASSVPVIAVNAQGQITSASSSAIAIAASQITSGALAIANGGTGATSAATALTNLGAYPASNPSGFTSNTGTVTSVNLTAGTGVSVSGGPITSSGSITVTNTAPDQVVSLTGSGATTVTGTYPNFTISSPASGAGTVTSIDVSGGTTGLTTSGGPVTTSGTITLAGTLNVANGGTGATTLSSGYVLKGNGTSAVSASVIYDDGTNVGIGTTLPVERLRVEGNIIVPISKSFYSYTADYGIGTPDSNGLQIFTNTADVMRFGQRAAGAFTERMRINASGNLLVGTTTDFGGRLTLIPATTPTTFAGGNQLQIGEATNNTAYRLQMGYINDPVQGYVGSLQAYAGSVPTNLCLQGDGGNVIVGGATSVYGTSGRGLIETNGATSAINALKVGGTAIAYFGVNSSAAEIVTPGAIPLNFLTSNTQRLSINSSGNVTANVDMRAPIYYDSANTSYYLDPAGGSRLNAVYVTGGDVDPSNIGAGVGIGNIYEPATAFAAYGIAFGASAGQHGAIVYGSNIMYFGTENGSDNTMMTKATLNSSGSFTANGDVRAPIFYDSANTSYYLDPTGSTSLNTAGNLITSGNLTLNNGANRYVRIGSATNYSYDLQTTGDDFQIIEAGTTPRLTIKYPSGNVGIGTVTPLAKSHVVASTPTGIGALPSGVTGILDSSGNNYLLFRHSADNATYSGIAFQDNNMGGYVVFGNYGANPSDQLAIAGYNGGILQYGTSDTINPALRTTVASWNSTGLQINNGDMRAPIYYDSDNTGYYLDPASGSNLNGTLVNSGGTAMTAGWNRNMMLAATFPVLVFNSANAKYSGIGVDYTSADAGMYFWVNGSSSDVTGTGTIALGINTGNFVTAFGSSRAPIFYDSNNTAYYIDAASTSVLNDLNVASGNVLGAIATFNNMNQVHGQQTDFNAITNFGVRYVQGNTNGPGISGATQYYGFSLGLGSNYPYSDYASQFYWPRTAVGGLPYPSVRFREAGAWSAWSKIYAGWADAPSGATFAASGDFRAPIFYDSNNTAYYLDPAAGSRLGGQVLFDGGTVIQGNGDVYSRRSSGTTGVYYFADGGSKYLFWDGGAYFFGSAGFTQSDVSMRAPIFYDSNNTGFFIDAASTSSLITLLAQNLGVYDSGQTNDPYGKIAVTRATDGNNYSYYGLTRAGQLGAGFGIDTSNRFWWGSATPGYAGVASAIGMTMSMGGTLSVTADVRAPIFYDSNDTGYYLDPNGFSNLNRANFIAQSTDTSASSIYLGGQNVTTSGSLWINFHSDGDTNYRIGKPAGAWTQPLEIRFYTGQRFRASPAYGGFQFINIENSAVLFDIGNGSAFTRSNVNFYAPIMYDNNDSGFYVDPNGTSVLQTVSLGVQTWRGDITWNTGVNILVAASAECSFDVASAGVWQVWDLTVGAPMIKATAGTNVEIGQAGSRGLYVYGAITATGNVTAFSDIRIKANVETIPNALDKLDQIRGVTYTRTDLDDKEQRYAGVIAQEIETVLPEAVRDHGDIKAVDYNATIGLLIEAVKELTNKVKALEAKEQ